VGYDYAKNQQTVAATWSSADGNFDGSTFTPSVYGKVNVTATVGGLTASKQLVVEEALRVTSITVTADDKTTKDAPVDVVAEALNQFGQPASQLIDFALRRLTATDEEETTDAILNAVDNHHLTFRATKMGQYAIVATCNGVTNTHRIYVGDASRQNLLSQYRNVRVQKENYYGVRRTMKKFNLKEESRKTAYEGLLKMSMDQYLDEAKTRVAGKKNIILILADLKQIDQDALKKYGKVRILKLDELFPND
jgi:hypothetical protein